MEKHSRHAVSSLRTCIFWIHQEIHLDFSELKRIKCIQFLTNAVVKLHLAGNKTDLLRVINNTTLFL